MHPAKAWNVHERLWSSYAQNYTTMLTPLERRQRTGKNWFPWRVRNELSEAENRFHTRTIRAFRVIFASIFFLLNFAKYTCSTYEMVNSFFNTSLRARDAINSFTGINSCRYTYIVNCGWKRSSYMTLLHTDGMIEIFYKFREQFCIFFHRYSPFEARKYLIRIRVNLFSMLEIEVE